MEIIYNWEITAMEVILNQDGLSNVVSNIDWRLIATIENEPYMASNYSKQYVGSPNPETFVDYENLTKEQVVSWLESTLDVEHLKENLAYQIDLQINPIVATLNPPFAN